MRPKRVWPFETADSNDTISSSLQSIVDWMGWISRLLFKIVWRTYVFLKKFFFSTKNARLTIHFYHILSGWLTQLGVQYIDLYLIHHPRLAIPDIPTAWSKMEDLKNHGLVKYIYISHISLLELSTHVYIFLHNKGALGSAISKSRRFRFC